VADDNYNVNISGLSFEWDERKAALNKKKHGLSFEEAKTVFYDEAALLIYDPDHSEKDHRFILLGLSEKLRMLVVCHTYRKWGPLIRIVSAREATRSEQRQYWRRWLE
jgi:uncharacterized DUF497 family protein